MFDEAVMQAVSRRRFVNPLCAAGNRRQGTRGDENGYLVVQDPGGFARETERSQSRHHFAALNGLLPLAASKAN